MILLGLSGYARTGKDTVANILVNEHGFERVSYADALKDVAYRIDPMIETSFWVSDDGHLPLSKLIDLVGWEQAKDDFSEVRRLLQNLGVTLREVIDENVWVNLAFRKINYGDDDRYVIPDVRFPNEMGAIRYVGGKVIRIERPGYGPVNGHVSETALDNAKFDYTLSNDGTVTKLEHWCSALVAELEQEEPVLFV